MTGDCACGWDVEYAQVCTATPGVLDLRLRRGRPNERGVHMNDGLGRVPDTCQHCGFSFRLNPFAMEQDHWSGACKPLPWWQRWRRWFITGPL